MGFVIWNVTGWLCVFTEPRFISMFQSPLESPWPLKTVTAGYWGYIYVPPSALSWSICLHVQWLVVILVPFLSSSTFYETTYVSYTLCDENLQKTALRETFEEVGIIESSINVIRELTDVYIPPSNFLATPFIGFVDQKPDFDLNYEVDKTIEVLVSDLLNDANITSVNMNTSYMNNVEVPCFKLNDYIVWGATAMMLSEIKELLK